MSVPIGTPITLVNNTNHTGTITSPVATIPAGVGSALFAVVSTTFTDPATQIDVTLEWSPDGGTAWQTLLRTTAVGGSCVDRAGNPAGPSALVNIDPRIVGLPVRGSIVTVGTVRFAVQLTLFL